jgi:hypothetical protein
VHLEDIHDHICHLLIKTQANSYTIPHMRGAQKVDIRCTTSNWPHRNWRQFFLLPVGKHLDLSFVPGSQNLLSLKTWRLYHNLSV